MRIISLSFDDGFERSNQQVAAIYEKFGLSACFNLLALEEVEQACKEFDPRRLFLNVSCTSEAQAQELVENTLRWCE